LNSTYTIQSAQLTNTHAALRQYENRILGYSKELALQLSRRTGKAINAAEWFHFYSFDVMGDVAFGNPFDLLKTGKPHFALDLLCEGMKPLGVLTPIPWMFCILISIPGLSAGFKTFVAWCAEQVKERKKVRDQI
jgi:cytochrome P450